MNKYCFRCKEEICQGEAHFCIQEYNEDNVFVREDFVHRNCWNKFKNQMHDVSEAQDILKGLKKRLTSLGMLDKEEVIRI